MNEIYPSRGSPNDSPGIAPADAVPRAPWPMWRRILAYAILAAIACASIVFIDSRARMPWK
jgi:hypothetical protein